MSVLPPPLALEEAVERLLAIAAPLPCETVPVEQASGRHLASDLLALRTQPPADLSAMDGYAVRSDELEGPWRVVGESAAGHPYGDLLGSGEAIRISTGAHMPPGDVCVVMQEDVSREGQDVALSGEGVPTTRHIRRAGYDFREGQTLLRAGSRMDAAKLALALTAGHAEITVGRLPSLAIIDSGDELAKDPANCLRHQIPASNGPMLAAMVTPLTGATRRIGPVPDRLDAVVSAFEQAGEAEVIVTSGGASVGDHDLIKPALEQWGATIDFWRVAIKPGKPLMVGRKGSQVILGLPGNPASAYVTAYFFLLPLLRHLSGASECSPKAIGAITTEDLAPGGKRREFLRARLDGDAVTAFGLQDSGGVLALATANVLIDRPAGADGLKAGTSVPVYLLENGGIA